jgi:hypothetical protein
MFQKVMLGSETKSFQRITKQESIVLDLLSQLRKKSRKSRFTNNTFPII